MFELKIIYI